MPGATWTVSRCPPDLSCINITSTVLTPSQHFRHLNSGSLVFVFLIHTWYFSSTFSVTLTTMALYHSSLRWFIACSCKPTMEGQTPIFYAAFCSTLISPAHFWLIAVVLKSRFKIFSKIGFLWFESLVTLNFFFAIAFSSMFFILLATRAWRQNWLLGLH